MKARIPLILAALALAGCATPEPEWTRERQAQVTSVRLPGILPRAAIAASERVMKLADGTDVSYEFRDNGFLARRKFFAYIVIGGMIGTYDVDVAAAATGAGTVLTVRMFPNITSYGATGPIPAQPSLWTSSGAYTLFFARVRQQLGLRPDWITCDAAPATLGVAKFELEPLCAGASDASP